MNILMASIIVIAYAAVSCRKTNDQAPNELRAVAGSEEVIFDSSACAQRIPGGFRRGCVAKSTTVATELPSDSQDPFVKGLSFENLLSYRFVCESSAPLDASIGLEDRSIQLAQSRDSNVVVLPAFAVPYAGSSYNVQVQPEPHIAVAPDCKLSIYNNVTLPPTAAIDSYATLLAESYEEREQLLANVREAADLPAKWSVVQDIPRQLVQRSNSRQVECRWLAQRARSLLRLSPQNRSLQQLTEIGDLLGDTYKSLTFEVNPDEVCRTFSLATASNNAPSFCTADVSMATPVFGGKLGKIVDDSQSLLCLARDVAEGLPRVSACIGDGMAACLDEVSSVENKLLDLRSSDAARVKSLQLFLSNEISRLHQRAADIALDLNSILVRMPVVN